MLDADELELELKLEAARTIKEVINSREKHSRKRISAIPKPKPEPELKVARVIVTALVCMHLPNAYAKCISYGRILN